MFWLIALGVVIFEEGSFMNINNHKFLTDKQMYKNMRTSSGRLFSTKWEVHMHGRTHLRFMVNIVSII